MASNHEPLNRQHPANRLARLARGVVWGYDYYVINRMEGMIQMLAELITEEFGLEFNDDSLETGFKKMISDAMGMIHSARELIGDDALMYMIINPIASSISATIAIMLDNDDADDLARVADQIAVMIMDSFAD